MGRWKYSNRLMTDECKSISVFNSSRATVVTGSGEVADRHYQVSRVSTACHFGGVRWWFICPGTENGENCGRRVALLYLVRKVFACRHCHNLVYGSSREHRSFSEPFSRRLKLIRKREAIFKNKGRKGFSKHQISSLVKLIQKASRLPKLPEPVAASKTKVIKKGKKK